MLISLHLPRIGINLHILCVVKDGPISVFANDDIKENVMKGEYKLTTSTARLHSSHKFQPHAQTEYALLPISKPTRLEGS